MTRRVRSTPRSLAELARRHGILTEYIDARGELRRASRATLQRLLRSMEVRPARRGGVSRPRRRGIPSDGAFPTLWLQPSSAGRTVRWRGPPLPSGSRWIEWHEEDAARGRRLRVRPSGTVRLPGPLRSGVHQLRRPGDGTVPSMTVVVAPHRLPPPPGGRQWGLFVPVYGLRDDRTWGCGDFRALEAVGRWAARFGATVLATLPLLPAFLDRPFEPSPYRPASQRFWNEVYLDPTTTPEFRRSRSLRPLLRTQRVRRTIARLERRSHVNFRAVARLKRRVIERMLTEFTRAPPARQRAFRRFVRRTDGLEAYVQFRGAGERDPVRGAEYHRFAQWLVAEQLEGVRRRLARRGVRLGLDLPLGTHPSGFEPTEFAKLRAHGVHLGSPPDPGVPEGQDWGLPAFDPARLRRAGWVPWVAAVRHQLRIAGLLRIDHVLGLHRLFWIPEGRPPREGAYVRWPAHDAYRLLLAEADRAHATIVGEDLGTVPPDLRLTLRRHGLLAVYVAELEWDGTGTPRRIPRDCVASLNTHDHLPFAGYWADRQRNGSRGRPAPGFPSPRRGARAAFRIALARLARSPARFLLVNIEDLWGETSPQNVPGRQGRYFTRRFRVDLATLLRDAPAAELLSTVDAWRRRRYVR